MTKRSNKGRIGYPANNINGIFSFNEIYSEALEVYDIEYIVLAGGGTGTRYYGGGGAGGVLCSELYGKLNLSLNVPYKLIVGAGGAYAERSSGNNSQFTDDIIAYGGGGESNNGGSGGGNNGVGVYPGSTYISGPRQGYDGAGSARSGTNWSLQPGGGGAGEAGEDLNTLTGGFGYKSGDGGDGITLTLLNDVNYGVLHTDGNYYIAGGGGGGKSFLGDGTNSANLYGYGGLGGGGSKNNTINGSYGSGGGAGQGGTGYSERGQGGDGVIILKIPNSITPIITSGVTYTTTAVTGNVVYIITETTTSSETITLT